MDRTAPQTGTQRHRDGRVVGVASILLVTLVAAGCVRVDVAGPIAAATSRPLAAAPTVAMPSLATQPQASPPALTAPLTGPTPASEAATATPSVAALPATVAPSAPVSASPSPSAAPSLNVRAPATGARTDRARRRGTPSDQRRLRLIATRTGGMAPKSIVATQTGRFFAQNMMYGHSITIFDRRVRRVRTLSDQVILARFGYRAWRQPVRGAPVEAALSADRRDVFVSQYSMYGPGFSRPGWDLCRPQDGIDRSFVTRINVRTLRTTAAYRVGAVPKYLAASPDGRLLLVANWCSWDLSIVDLERGREVKRLPIGANPRGIAFSPDSRRAYVSLVGEGDIVVVDLRRLRVVRTLDDVGVRPRHLGISPDGRFLYVTVQGDERPRRRDGSILKLELRTGRVVARTTGLDEPRTTVLAPDGRSLYVVDYHPGTIVKVATRDMSVRQEVSLGRHPIGIAYDEATRQVWVAGYTGSVWVLRDR